MSLRPFEGQFQANIYRISDEVQKMATGRLKKSTRTRTSTSFYLAVRGHPYEYESFFSRAENGNAASVSA